MQKTMKEITNNQVTLSGKVVSELQFSHEFFGEGFYIFDVEVKRLSESKDVIPVMVSEKLINVSDIIKDKFVHVEGQYRSYNKHEGEKSRLELTVFAREICFINEQEDDENQIFLNGFICRQVTYRKTPLGREISDVLVAVNRAYGKTDYIPCIAWGRDAKWISKFGVGLQINVYGRIQSRTYQKKLSEECFEKRVAYEVSANRVEVVN